MKSLVDLCTAMCIRHVREIEDVGCTPYKLLRSVLMKCDNAAQLHKLEEASPHLKDDTGECWLRLIERKFRVVHKRMNLSPNNPEDPEGPKSWSEIYDFYEQHEAESMRMAAEKLSNTYKDITNEKASKAATLISIAKCDKRFINKQSGSKRFARSTGLTFGGGSRTKPNSSVNVMKKARREAAEIALRHQLSTPTGQLQVRPGQITKAPLGMQWDNQRENRAATRIQAPRAPQSAQSEREQKELQERRDRLMKAKMPRARTNPDDEDDEDSHQVRPTSQSLNPAAKTDKSPTLPQDLSKSAGPSPSVPKLGTRLSGMSMIKSSRARTQSGLSQPGTMRMEHVPTEKKPTSQQAPSSFKSNTSSTAAKPVSSTASKPVPTGSKLSSSTLPTTAGHSGSGSEQPPQRKVLKRKAPPAPSVFMKKMRH